MPRFYTQLLAVMQSFFSKSVVAFLLLLLSFIAARAQSGGIFEGYTFFDVNGTFTTYHLQTNTGGTYFDGANLGTFCNAQSLVFRGGENKIFKCDGCDFTGGAIYYRVYPQGGTAPGFTQLQMGFLSNDPGGLNGCQNQTWQTTSGTQNILAGLSNGTYVLEVYNEGFTNNCGGNKFYSNNGANFKATFTVKNNPNSGIFESYIVLNSKGGGNSFFDLAAGTSNTDFNGADLGTFCTDETLVLAGGQNKTFKCPGDDILGGRLWYRVYSGTPAGSFTPISLGFKSDDPGALCAGGQNQTWETINNTTNLIQGLTPGSYTLEVYTDAQYNSCINGTHFSNNAGNNFKATFTVAAPVTFYRDADGDGYGNPAQTIQACTVPAGYVADNTDCDDNNGNVWRTGTFYVDADGDGYTVGNEVEVCYGVAVPAGYKATSLGADCNDNDATAFALPLVAPITAATDNVCVNATLQLSNVTTGGLWSSSSANASVNGSGLVTGLTAGTATIGYAVTNSCGTTTQTFVVTVNPAITLATQVTDVSCVEGTDGKVVLNVNGGTPATTTLSKQVLNENFNDMGSSATATIPSAFKVGTDWTTGRTATTHAAGTTGSGVITGSSTGGIYNWANGVTASSTDRALGFLNSGSFSTPDTIIVKLDNTTGSTVSALNISFDYEKYRSGSRAFGWTFFHGASTNPTTPATAGNHDFPADANNTTVFNPPLSINKSFTITGLNIPAGSSYYLKWILTGVGGSTNGQGLAIDNVVVNMEYTSAPTYSYVWAPGGTTTKDLIGVAVGTYSVTVTDSKGCQATTTATVGAPPAITGSAAVTSNYNGAQLSCATATDGQITVTASGGTGALQYSINGGSSYQSSNVFDGLGAGSYEVRVKDAKGCVFDAGSVTITAPAALSGSASVTSNYNGAQLSCATATDGQITVTASGGTGALKYSINGGSSYQSSNVFSNLSANTYQVKVKDANACEFTVGSVTITAPPAISLSTTVTDVTCVEGTDGKVVLNVTGGTLAPKLIVEQNFNSLASTGTSSTLPAGWFFVESGSNANTTYSAGTGSSNTGDTYSFGDAGNTERALGGLRSGSVIPTFGAEFTNTTGKTVKQITISYTGEQWRLGATNREDRLDFQYSTNATSLTTGSWIDVNQLDFVAPVTTGTTGALNGNASSNRTAKSYTITGLNLAPNAKFWIRWTDFDATGSDDGLAVDDFSLTMAYDETDYRYQWSNGATTKDLNNVPAGDYTVTVTDANGCQSTTSVTVNQKDNIPPVAVCKNIDVHLDANGTATITPAMVDNGSSDNCSIVEYSLSKTSFTCEDVGAQQVTLTVKDADGNTASCVATVTVKDVANPVLTPANNQDVNLDNDCEITVPDVRGTATDNCAGTVITQLPAAGTKLSAVHNQTINITVKATDAAGNKDEKTVVLTAKDVTNPVLTPANDQSVNLDPGCEITVPDVRGAATDNCAGTVITQLPAAGTKLSAVHNQTINITVTATDAAGNKDEKTVVLTAKDVTPPTITCPPSITTASDAGAGTKTLTTAEIGMPAFSDNCSATLSWSRSDGAASLTAPFNFGTTTITWTATDAGGNTASCQQTITVDKVTTTTTVSVSPGTAQYSDRVTFTATVTPWNVSGAGNIGGTVTFRIGTQVMGTAPVINGTATLANLALLETTPAGQLEPGNRLVSAGFAGTDVDYTVNDPSPATLTITHEDARVEYIGQEAQATPSMSSSAASVQLTVTVADITAITGDPAFDHFAGDIRNARVRFVNRDNNTAISGWLTPTLINGDTKVGIVSYAWNAVIPSGDAASFTVGIEVEGYYTRNDPSDNVVITVYKPIGDFVAGGGFIRVNNSSGSIAASNGTKMNFGLNVKFNKRGTNLQGGVNMIFRRNVNGTIRTYQIRSNSMTSLGVSGTTNDRIAQFLSKANLTDVTDPQAPVSLGGNLDLRVSLRDRGEPSVNDEIGVTLLNSNGTLLFSSNWNVTNTVRTLLNGGNIYINSANFGAVTSIRSEGPVAATQVEEVGALQVKVLGNPTLTEFGLCLLSSDRSTKITLRVTDVNGRIVEVRDNLYTGQFIQLGGGYVKGVYFAEVTQGDQRRVVRLVKME